MTFEEEKMSFALSTLRSMDKRCSSELATSPFSSSLLSIKSRIWGGSTNNVFAAAAASKEATNVSQILPNTISKIILESLTLLKITWSKLIKMIKNKCLITLSKTPLPLLLMIPRLVCVGPRGRWRGGGKSVRVCKNGLTGTSEVLGMKEQAKGWLG
jgi:hypothetical protein